MKRNDYAKTHETSFQQQKRGPQKTVSNAPHRETGGVGKEFKSSAKPIGHQGRKSLLSQTRPCYISDCCALKRIKII